MPRRVTILTACAGTDQLACRAALVTAPGRPCSRRAVSSRRRQDRWAQVVVHCLRTLAAGSPGRVGPLTGEPDRIAYSWQTRVLLSPTASTTKGITVLDSQRPGPVTSEEIAQVPGFPRPRNEDLLRQLARDAREAGASPEFLDVLDDLRSSAPGRYPPLEDSLRYLSGRADGETYRRLMEMASHCVV